MQNWQRFLAIIGETWQEKNKKLKNSDPGQHREELDLAEEFRRNFLGLSTCSMTQKMLSKQVKVGQASNRKQMSTELMNCRKQMSTELKELPAQRPDISRNFKPACRWCC